jgi:hypothetical protein
MLIPINKILLGLVLCLMLSFYMGCDMCRHFDDAALVGLAYDIDSHVDSIAMIANDSIIGCDGISGRRLLVGAKTHNIKFPINAQVQLFSQGKLWKEFFVDMDKNTEVTIFTGNGCSHPSAGFSSLLVLAKEQNRFIDFSFTADYCWLLEKMDGSYDRCIEMGSGSKWDLCGKEY